MAEAEVAVAVAEAKRSFITPAWIQKLPFLGVGVGFRKIFKKAVFSYRSQIDFLEIITDQYIQPSLEQRIELSRLKNLFPIVPHSLGLSLASAEPTDEEYLNQVASIAHAVKAPWFSDHIAMTRFGRLDIGHLAPVPFTHEFVDITCRNIQRVRSVIPKPFILENISYTHTFGGEMSEAEFIKAILEQSDCGLLLDLMNLYANSQNHQYDPYKFLNDIPLERVVQVHIIGGHWDEGLLIDSHSSVTPTEVWNLLKYVADRVKIRAVLLEWDDQLPNFQVVLKELAIAREIVNR